MLARTGCADEYNFATGRLHATPKNWNQLHPFERNNNHSEDATKKSFFQVNILSRSICSLDSSLNSLHHGEDTIYNTAKERRAIVEQRKDSMVSKVHTY
jgi:hypothetical protein